MENKKPLTRRGFDSSALRMTDNMRNFLDGLTKLTMETGVMIAGCGCCGSPYLSEVSGYISGSYTVEPGNGYSADNLTFVEGSKR